MIVPTDRPLAWIDCETTGTEKTSRIVELAIGIQELGESAPGEWKVRRLNPGEPIPAEASEVHGIRDEDVAALPPFDRYASSLYALLDPCDLAGFGIRRFDVHVLAEEFRRAGITFDLRSRRTIDLLSIFHHEEPRDLAGAVYFYLGRSHDAAHSADGDTRVLPEILEAQIERYGLPQDLDGLQAYLDEHSPLRGPLEDWFEISDPAKPIDWVFRRGKWKGRTLGWVSLNESGYCWWMVNKAEDMASEVRDAIRPFARAG